MHPSSRLHSLSQRSVAALLAVSLLVTTSCVGFGARVADSAGATADYSGAWLRGLPLDPQIAPRYQSVNSTVLAYGTSDILEVAQDEVLFALKHAAGVVASPEPVPHQVMVQIQVVGRKGSPALSVPKFFPDDSYILRTEPDSTGSATLWIA